MQNFKSETHLLNTFYDFWRRFLRVWLQSLEKILKWPIFLYIKKGIRKRRISCWFQILKLMLLFLAFFLNFECKCTRDGSKKRKTFFSKRVLDFNEVNHQRVSATKLLKSLYPIWHAVARSGHKRFVLFFPRLFLFRIFFKFHKMYMALTVGGNITRSYRLLDVNSAGQFFDY